jgi:hypothetical protein
VIRESSDVEMLKGTLDMMILRTLVAGDAHGHTIAKIIERTSETSWKSSRARSTPRCTAWKIADGFLPFGGQARTTAKRSSTV